MRKTRQATRWMVSLLFLFALAEPPPAAALSPPLTLVRAFPGLEFEQPVALVQPAGEKARWFLAEKGGRILTFVDAPGTPAASVALDLRRQVNAGPSEAGLLGLAFHPDFSRTRAVFVSYTSGPSRTLVSRISRFTSRDGKTIDPQSEEILLSLKQPYANHNGGNIAFGPDGFLYIGFGDGGGAGDPQKNAQNTGSLLGAILRIDVDKKGRERPYAIPPDNPFIRGGGAPEIFAWGLRNPWRFTFDRGSGRLWAADVGQDAWEEIDFIEKGGNYGWDIREGAHCFEPPKDCPQKGLIEPVAEYPNAGQDCSVTGGYVYRGSALPDLQGTYLFADFCSGRIWGLPLGQDGRPTGPHQLLLESGLSISSFAEGNDGELYVLDFRGGTVQKLLPAAAR